MRSWACVLTALVLLFGCANPVSPTGGPADTTPPTITEATPASGAVLVSGDRLRVRFSEYINTSTFTQAYEISPAPEGRPKIEWHGRDVEIQFEEPFRPNTTYLLTIDTSLRDANGVALKQPLTLAFSTGAVINKGSISGVARGAATGAPAAALDVFAYALANSSAPALLPARPDYRTQTAADGTFTFNYLAEQPYYVVVLQDRNRNRRPDPGETFGAPPRAAILADTLATEPVRFTVGAVDTVSPSLIRVRPLTARRAELRFNEPVVVNLDARSEWVLSDSATGARYPIRGLYTGAMEPRQVTLVTDSLPGRRLRIMPAGVIDTTGNPFTGTAPSFILPAGPDTVRARFRGFYPPPGQLLPPGEMPVLRFTAAPDSIQLQAGVSVQDTARTRSIPFRWDTPNGLDYRIIPEAGLQPGQPVRILVQDLRFAGADTVFTATFEAAGPETLGAISGYVVAPQPDTVQVELTLNPPREAQQPHVRRIESPGPFRFENLPEGMYRIRAFADRNVNGRWDAGTLMPYAQPESIIWTSDSLRVRPRWETELPDTLRLR